ncbi:unnamed protein product [Boreogadus saida]
MTNHLRAPTSKGNKVVPPNQRLDVKTKHRNSAFLSFCISPLRPPHLQSQGPKLSIPGPVRSSCPTLSHAGWVLRPRGSRGGRYLGRRCCGRKSEESTQEVPGAQDGKGRKRPRV